MTEVKHAIKKVLVANRGEIACRVIRTLHELGISSVAVYSDADASALHVQMANEAVSLGPAPVTESYLNVDALISAIKSTSADAVHPGYGLLSENPEFAEAVVSAGAIWIGPPPSAMRGMASKTMARQKMQAAGVPVVPGGGIDASSQVGFPLLVKAAAGGGGKGMRRVDIPQDLNEAVATCAREAEKSFGDGTVYLEKLVLNPRHVEVQVMGDAHGNIVHLFERECSVQRRHQKVVEESPSPVLTEGLREKMGQAAVKAAEAVDYIGAGTVEFLLDDNEQFYFLEMNTRLQVEHPVTELVVGRDLVADQIRVAAGEPLGYSQADLEQRGHAIECRIYAEDSATYLPQTGKIHLLRVPEGPGIRHDGGVYEGWEVSVHYDPMLAKLCTWGATRDEAIARMRRALSEYVILGLVTNVQLLSHILSHPVFIKGDATTGFLDEHPYVPPEITDDNALIACALASHFAGSTSMVSQGPSQGDAYSPWQKLGGWRA